MSVEWNTVKSWCHKIVFSDCFLWFLRDHWGASETLQFLFSEALGCFLSKVKHLLVKTLRGNQLNAKLREVTFQIQINFQVNSVYFLRSGTLSRGWSWGTVCGQAVDTLSHLAHWADQPGLQKFWSHKCHGCETSHRSPLSLYLFSHNYAVL